MQKELQCALVEAVTRSSTPGAVAYVGRGAEVLFHEAVGLRQSIPQQRSAEKDTIYDLASLTKVIATTTAIMILRNEGSLDLDQPVSELLPLPAFQRITIRHLLTHTSGLPRERPYYKEVTSVLELLQRYAEAGLEWEPGTRRRYSDVGFMVLGKVVEMAARDSLDAFCRKRIFVPLGMEHTGFNPPPEWVERCAATEDCPWRKRVIVGAVHDENAYAVGGVAGHAGLFAPAEDIARFCRALLNGTFLPEQTVEEMTRLGEVTFYPWQGLGWWIDPWSSEDNSSGFLPSRMAFGHSGWTGTSVWLDRATGLFAILLGNTCHPSRFQRDNDTFRRTFYAAVSRAFYRDSSAVHTGLDRVVREEFVELRGKRLALLTNQAAVDQLGRPILDVLALEPGVKVHVLYAPEHGLRGQAEAGAPVPSEKDRVPVISLYGGQEKPTPEQLEEIALFVVDLQDVGSRYYTYIATMKACMEACAAAGKPMLVLDRPNPVGGVILEGPIAQQTSAPTCCAPIPIRHGMTMGELAHFFVEHVPACGKLKLHVSALDNWRPELLFSQCSLPWVPPSPNMAMPETALVYVGTCLFEGANLNEGRGTDMPFHVVGAPWLDTSAVIGDVSQEDRRGCALERVTYTPQSLPGKASSPKYYGQVCQGIRIVVEDAHRLRPFRLALSLLSAIRRQHAREFQWNDCFDTLAGGSVLRQKIEQGASVGQIVAGYDQVLVVYDESRPRLYTELPEKNANL